MWDSNSRPRVRSPMLYRLGQPSALSIVWNFGMSVRAQANVHTSWVVGLHWARPQRLWRLRFHSWNSLAVKYPPLLSRGIRQICLPKLQLGNLTYLGHCLEHWSFKQALCSEGRISWYFHFLKDEKKLKVTHVKILLMRLTWSRRITLREK